MQHKKLPSNSFKKILAIIEEERVFIKGESELMLEEKLMEIENIAQEFLTNVKENAGDILDNHLN